MPTTITASIYVACSVLMPAHAPYFMPMGQTSLSPADPPMAEVSVTEEFCRTLLPQLTEAGVIPAANVAAHPLDFLDARKRRRHGPINWPPLDREPTMADVLAIFAADARKPPAR